jgi:DNA-binding transcriptional ArsR family regulator
MTDNEMANNTGWSMGQSIAVELDVALSIVKGYFGVGQLPEEAISLQRALPADWQAEASEMLGESRHLLSILEAAASLAGVIQEGDYGRATLAIRELTVEEALARAEAAAGRYEPAGGGAPAELPAVVRLAELWLAVKMALFTDLSLPIRPGDPLAQRRRQDMEHAARILRGGDLHDRFWHWLDRFYYGFYQPWREAQAGTMAALETRAMAMLGAREHWGDPPSMAWLPEISPLRIHPELAAAVQAGRLRIFFWIEPFGLADLWSLQAGWLLLSFAEPGTLYQNFHAFAGDVAARAKALGDPTRLIILRMIRHLGLHNTEMANALGLARPTVSVHAKILRDAGLIRSHREGREVRHELVPEEVQRLFRDLRDLLDLED